MNAAMKAFLPRILALAMVAISVTLGATGEPETKATSQAAAALAPRPVAPALDNLTPAQAGALNGAYWKRLDDWKKLQPTAGKESNIQESSVNQDQKKELREEGVAKPAPKASAYDWRQQAVRSGLSESTRSKLENDGLAIGGPFLRESFEVYTTNFLPSFVTSDSLLNTFHVLLEDTVKRMESKRAGRLRQILEESWKSLDPKLTKEKIERAPLEPYIRHLALVIGPALRLLGSDVKLGDVELEALVAAEVKKIEAADTMELPAWLAPAEPDLLAIDYRRCKPIGFYADNSRLVAYYRASRWLQMVPFRLSRDVELGAIGLLGDLGQNGNDAFDSFITAGQNVWGEAGDLDTSMNNHHPRFLSNCSYRDVTYALKEERAIYKMAAKSHRPKLNDQVRLPPADADSPQELIVRVLPAAELPDAVMLAELMRQKEAAGENRPWPKGLDVASWLGSKWAAQAAARFDEAKKIKSIAPIVDQADFNRRLGNGLPGLYYSALNALFLPANERAPGFMKSEAWERKSVQTALAGWAQLRHTWELQAKLNEMYAGIRFLPAGFVEPNPEFFDRLSRLISAAFDLFEEGNVFEFEVGDELEFLEKAMSEMRASELRHHRTDSEKMTDTDEDLTSVYFDAAYFVSTKADLSSEEDDESSKLLEDHFKAVRSETDPRKIELMKDEFFRASERNYQKHIARLLQARIEGLRSGKLIPDPKSTESVRRLKAGWRELERLTRQLEAMAYKQLAGGEWNSDEHNLLTKYGEILARIMGYGGNAWETPKDDAPRWTTVFSDPVRNKRLAVAIGRPQALYVLYPWKGQQVLCRGAVMSYYEYETDRRLTDKEWKDELDKPNPPKRPDWMQPLLPTN